MASRGEILDALADYSQRCNGNEKLRRMLQGWTRLLHFQASDSGEVFTVQVTDGRIVATAAGASRDADLVVSATSEDLCDMFWGDLNPVQKYMNGEIVVRGNPADVMRLDAMASLIWAG
ncbi:MAG: SCP2 sterol-binding domain-containing protein [Acidimicrobiales bacterium]